MADERFLVTGGTGCIGSWVVRALVHEGVPVTVFASSGRVDRLRLILSPAELAVVSVVQGDVTDVDALERIARGARVTSVVHLAALQLPLCAADPINGARVNVQGTAAMFELVRRLELGRLVYASSAAVYGPATTYPAEVVGPDAPLAPTSHYGVFKMANEGAARVYADAWGIASIGLRPHSAYGPGRDQGVTSKPTLAMIAAAGGRPFHVDFDGSYQFQFVEDVAAAFVAAARSDRPGAQVFSIGGPRIAVGEMVRLIEDIEPSARGRITHGDRILPFPAAFDGAPLEAALGRQPLTPVAEGVRRTIETYRAALGDGRLGTEYLDRVLG
ncbi:MAG TPA: NAD-dependent epimerase/dehydratase family protein [Candidatus Limnocylindrales bacterium]